MTQQAGISFELNQKFVGTEQRVLIDRIEDGEWVGDRMGFAGRGQRSPHPDPRRRAPAHGDFAKSASSRRLNLICMANWRDQEYPVMERFLTVQGEGAYTGAAAWFIRLGGCDVGAPGAMSRRAGT